MLNKFSIQTTFSATVRVLCCTRHTKVIGVP